jgi:hypothetical protein
MGASSEAYLAQMEREEYAREAAVDLLMAAEEALACLEGLRGIWREGEPVTFRLTREQLSAAISKARGR